uniref:Uncharacterized protein n=1 Tax=Mesocestoides corti TaxID=53468 RepID=A0A5K3FG13_MESCO
MACEEEKQLTRKGHGRGAVYDEQRGQRGGLGWKGSGILRWRRIRAQTYLATWSQPILCLSAFQWHATKISSQPEKDTTEVQCILSGVASVMDSGGRLPTCGSGS